MRWPRGGPGCPGSAFTPMLVPALPPQCRYTSVKRSTFAIIAAQQVQRPRRRDHARERVAALREARRSSASRVPKIAQRPYFLPFFSASSSEPSAKCCTSFRLRPLARRGPRPPGPGAAVESGRGPPKPPVRPEERRPWGRSATPGPIAPPIFLTINTRCRRRVRAGFRGAPCRAVSVGAAPRRRLAGGVGLETGDRRRSESSPMIVNFPHSPTLRTPWVLPRS
jgi:hypothetical protein